MTVSSYQAERMLDRMRRRRKRPAAGRAPGNGRPPAPSALPPAAAGVADTAVRPPPVDHELERRAGSFMRPPVVPWLPAKPIPKAKVPPPARRAPRKIAEGD